MSDSSRNTSRNLFFPAAEINLTIKKAYLTENLKAISAGASDIPKPETFPTFETMQKYQRHTISYISRQPAGGGLPNAARGALETRSPIPLSSGNSLQNLHISSA